MGAIHILNKRKGLLKKTKVITVAQLSLKAKAGFNAVCDCCDCNDCSCDCVN